MATSIQVSERTLQDLQRAKRELGAASYDDVVQRLLMNFRKRAFPVRGLTPGIGRFSREANDRD